MLTISIAQLPPGAEVEIWNSQIVPVDSPIGFMVDCDEQLIVDHNGNPVFFHEAGRVDRHPAGRRPGAQA